MTTDDSKTRKVTALTLIMTLGIVFGDIGTSPLYVMKTILHVNPAFDADYVIGAVSCVIWTLTLQTTLKYVVIALRADNKGEGGILALFSLLRRCKPRWLYIAAIVGASALVADGVITPAITVTTAIEGLNTFSASAPVIPIVLAIVTFIFILQYFGTKTIGNLFGPVMLAWFLMLGVLGAVALTSCPAILKAFNPVYAVRLLIDYPGWFLVLGAVFLCTTGAEALYSDLGHCGRRNISITWGFVKVMLILNYLGQGAWILSGTADAALSVNPFYGIMPQWFTGIGIVMSTLAAIIASQALLSGSFTLFSEAIGLDFFPRVRIKYPTDVKGQLFIPMVNIFLYLGCIFTVLIFRSSAHMEAAYGLAITITMLMTTMLLCVWMHKHKVHLWLILAFGITFFTLESVFFIANATKFVHGGWYTVLIAGFVFAVMYIWHRAETIRNKFVDMRSMSSVIPVIRDIKADKEIPLYASNVVYLSRAADESEVESKLVYSIVNKHPKRADHYWLIHIDDTDRPDTLEYDYTILVPHTLYRINLHLGFRVRSQLNVYFRQIVEDLRDKGLVDITSTYGSLSRHGIPGNFRFVILRHLFSPDSSCKGSDRVMMRLHALLRRMALPKEAALGLDTSNVDVENVPLIINTRPSQRITLRTGQDSTD